MQCDGFQVPLQIIMIIGPVFALVFLLMAVTASCRSRPIGWPLLPVAAVSVALCTVAVVNMALSTADAVTRMVECKGYPAATVASMRQELNIMCIDKDCGGHHCQGLYDWLSEVAMYYAGSALTIVATVRYIMDPLMLVCVESSAVDGECQ